MTALEIEAAAALRRAAVRATRAPSVHNTQPWRFVQRGGALEVHADWSRQLRVLDPAGRQLLLSCGCAVFNARAALAAMDNHVEVDRFPNPLHTDFVARLTPSTAVLPGEIDTAITHLDASIDSRRTNRRQFTDEAVPDELVRMLVDAARAEGAELFAIRRPEHRAATARLSQLADRIENAEPAYRAELRRWTTQDPGRSDGVPASAVPHVDGTAADDVPIRDFDTFGAGELPAHTRSSSDQCLLLLGTNADNPAAWARAGEALERIWLEITAHGFTASPFTQVVEVPRTRAALRDELGLAMQPHVLLRAGHAAATAPTRRRRLVDVLAEGR